MLTRVQTEILAYLATSPGCSTVSAFRMICDLDRAWRHGYYCLRRLEQAGLVHIHRKPGNPLTITLVNRP